MEATFDWRTLGKADYSQAAALVASLPADVRSQIKGVSHELLTRIVYLSWRFAEKSGRGSAYCWPTLAKFGLWAGRANRTISRHLSDLADAGLIIIRARTKQGGEHTSNLYLVGKSFLASLFARRGKKSPIKPATPKMATNDLKREYKASAPIQMGERLTDFLEKLRAQRQPLAGGQADEGAESGWGEENYQAPARRRLPAQLTPHLGPDGEEW